MAFEITEIRYDDQGNDNLENIEIRFTDTDLSGTNTLRLEHIVPSGTSNAPRLLEIDLTGLTPVVADTSGSRTDSDITFTSSLDSADGFNYIHFANLQSNHFNDTSFGVSLLADGEFADGIYVDPSGLPITLVDEDPINDPTNPDDGYERLTPTGQVIENIGVTLGNSNQTLQLQDDGSWVVGDATFGAENVCYLEGTMISTRQGDKTVESLNEGDLLLTSDGREVPVKWMGKQTVIAAFSTPERTAPVLIKKGALGENTPNADLYVTADHGMIVDGIIAHASALVNNETIVRVPLDEMEKQFTFWHIETEEHEIVLANGAPAETFIDNVSRQVFDNYSDFEAKFGSDVPEMKELDMLRALSQRQLPARIKNMLGIQSLAIA